MSRTDQNPDASMEEILASIRRIISEDPGDDLTEQRTRREAAAPARPKGAGAFANGIARALGEPRADDEGGASAEDDDILDLDRSPPPQGAVRAEPSRPQAPPVRPLAVAPKPAAEAPSPLATRRPQPQSAPPTAAQPTPATASAGVRPMAAAVPPLAVRPRADAPAPLGAKPAASQPRPGAAGPAIARPAAPAVPQPVAAKAEPPPTAAMGIELDTPFSDDVISLEVTGDAANVEESAMVSAAGPTPGASPATPRIIAEEVAPVAAAPAAEDASPTSAAVASLLPVRSLEDTVSELLKPMLREWLDANMPRIIAKALSPSDIAKSMGGAKGG